MNWTLTSLEWEPWSTDQTCGKSLDRLKYIRINAMSKAYRGAGAGWIDVTDRAWTSLSRHR